MKKSLLIAVILSVLLLFACKAPVPVPPAEELAPAPEPKISQTEPEGGKDLPLPEAESKVPSPALPAPGHNITRSGEKWTVTVDNGELLDALSELRIRVAALRPLRLGEADETGARNTVTIGGRDVDALALARALNLPSTVIDNIVVEKSLPEDVIHFEGRGESSF